MIVDGFFVLEFISFLHWSGEYFSANFSDGDPAISFHGSQSVALCDYSNVCFNSFHIAFSSPSFSSFRFRSVTYIAEDSFSG